MKDNFITLQNKSSSSKEISLFRITALWAFSESAFGGILHALSLPFRGALINAAAVLFITLIALFSEKSKEILKATLIVILVKAAVSPHSPITAYLAVSIQGFLGFIVFYNKKLFRLSALLLGVLTLLYSGIQKIIVLTVLFGNTLWKSINIFINGISKEFLQIGIHSDLNYSLILVISYIGIHLLIGIAVGLYAGKLPGKIILYSETLPKINFDDASELIPEKERKKKKHLWIFRPTGVIIIILSLVVLLLTFIIPEYSDARYEILIMVVRSLVLTFIWYIFLSSFFRKIFQKFLNKNKSQHAKEVNEMLNLFPQFRKIVSFCWKESQSQKGLRRLQHFLSRSFYYLLLST
ncbi:Hypothetical protein IALB_1655 [Ignavibacterium album JCM 16511]|uniref:Uncharacterized protein n=1 Tax=Ignavibacterium album (strain DSM 19864 / JCM 16511 / NBRC 101810 / Mat9-16) TaxID=945713 RepID=I0AK56_IGNAJ|nr:hypothetical protein [Ignavibacterium album]AFH49363.1 Hypothetical protein IALB_1655 [Ignavibacterium album JCM 16511]